jgi:urease accessory protein
MRATARLVATVDAAGRTVLSTVRAQAPLLPRRTGTAPDGAPVVHLVGGAAGPLGGDRLTLDVEVGPGAALEVRAVAATVALPGSGRSVSTVTARVAAGGVLRWLPEPLIAAGGCDHVASSTVDVAAGGRLLWREVLVCGRHGEEPGDARLAMTVRHDDRPLLVHELAVGPAAAGWAGAAVLGGARVVGSMLAVGSMPAVGDAEHGVTAVLRLAGPGVLMLALGADVGEVLERVDAELVTAVGPEPLRVDARGSQSAGFQVAGSAGT